MRALFTLAPGRKITEMSERTYLDHAATTPVDPRVVEAMLPYYREAWGNPSGISREAQAARKGLDAARDRIAAILDCTPAEIVFTSGGTEADNLALHGVAQARAHAGKHLISATTEHHAILHALEALAEDGFEVTLLPVDREGFIEPAAVQTAVRDDTTLVTIMTANNEVGTVQPIAEIARAVKERNPKTVVHTDAVQAAGALDIRPDSLGIDLLSATAHKIYGPKGIGLLYVRRRTPFQPQIVGGSQEADRRAGTENVAGAVAFATALDLAYQEIEPRNQTLRGYRDTLWREIRESIDRVHLNGPADMSRRLPNNLSLCLEGVEGESILLQLDLQGVAASSGSACTTGSAEPSHVLTAMGVDADLAHSALRLTVGTDNTPAQIQRVVDILPPIVEHLRALAPVQ